MPESPQHNWAVIGFRWIVCSLDVASGLCFILLGLLVLFASNWRLFHAIPNGWLGVLVLGHGIWAVVSGVTLITKQSSVYWRLEKRRHLIAATLSGSIVVLVWLATFIETSMYSPDGLGLGLGVFLYTATFVSTSVYFLIVSAVMRWCGRPSG